MNPKETEDLKVLMEKIRNDGVTVLLIEHDVKLMMGLCDRIAVLAGGKLSQPVPIEETDAERIGLLMSGVQAQAA